MRLSRMYLWSIVTTVIVCVAMLGNQFATIVYLPLSGQAFASSLILLACSVVGLVCAVVDENGRSRWWMRSGMIAGAVAAACWITSMFSRSMLMNYLWVRVFIWPTTWASLMMLVGILQLLPMHLGWRRAVRSITCMLLVVFALTVAVSIAAHPGYAFSSNGTWDEEKWRAGLDYEYIAWRASWVTGLVAAAAYAVTIVFGVVGAISGRSASIEFIASPYWLQCPRCGREQQAVTGDHYCESCGLRTKVVLA